MRYTPQDFEQDEIRTGIKTLVGDDYDKWFEGFEITSIEDQRLEYLVQNTDSAAQIKSHYPLQVVVSVAEVLKMTVIEIEGYVRDSQVDKAAQK